MDFIGDLIRSFFWFGGLIFWLGAAIFMQAKNVDKSNLFNFLRSFAFMCKHADELTSTYYLTDNQVSVLGDTVKAAFPYIELDEFSEIVKSRRR